MFPEYSIAESISELRKCLDQLNLDGSDMHNLHNRREEASELFRYLMNRPSFDSIFCQALRSTVIIDGYLENLCYSLNLSIYERVIVGFSLSKSDNLELRLRGKNFCIAHMEELYGNPNLDAPDNRIQEIVLSLHSHSESLDKRADTFSNMLSLVHLKESDHFILSPSLNDSNINSTSRNLDVSTAYSDSDLDSIIVQREDDINMVDVVKEWGYGFTANSAHCVEMFSLFLPLDVVVLAKLLGTIARTPSGLEDGHNSYSTFCSAFGTSLAGDFVAPCWNIDVLVDSIQQLAPKTNWINVMENLDHEGFLLPDETAFSLLMTVYNSACQELFPLHAVCGCVWTNAEGQLSFLKNAVSAAPDVFTFAHSSRKLIYLDSATVFGNQAWISLDLLDVLCELAKRGYLSVIRPMLENPLRSCPEILLAGISQVNTDYNILQFELSSIVLTDLMKDSSKSSAILRLSQLNSNLVVREFMNLYDSDVEYLMRITDICQESKILSVVLDVAPFSFRIKLAAVASHKNYINLEKWLDEKITLCKDPFFEECLIFLKDACSHASNDGDNISLHRSCTSLMDIYQRTRSIFFKVLQIHSGQSICDHLVDELKRLHSSFNSIIHGGVEAMDSVTAAGNSDEIATIANTYFKEMFFGKLTTDAFIKMLARFKESPINREQMIYECIVANLLDECNFIEQFPDKQLKLTAILYGSLIKHQLVDTKSLGVALRYILDSLCKSVDSKMFVFGTKALEQFMDRLADWPQYCNDILKISHLRASHPDLVLYIERVLARISSSQLESSGADQKQVSTSLSVERMEVTDSSWSMMCSSAPQPGQQLPSSQLRQRHHGFLDERLKATSTLNLTKPLSSAVSQSSLLSAPVDSVGSQMLADLQSLPASNSQYSSSMAAAASSPSFPRPPRSITPAGIRQPSYNTGFGSAINIGTLEAAAERREIPIEAPPSEVQDKIFFMINNMSDANLDAKAKEFPEVLREQYYPWFAQYMVMKRASIEPNYHDVYLKFLEKVDLKVLNKEILKATYENCKVLLRSDLIKSSSEERSLLRSLGSWLGRFTIGRNQALRAREIDPKVLIIEAYERGLLIAVVPFTSKILEPCQSSLAYQPPNPWTMAILGLFVEIYNLPNLKMNLIFDIEVLFKNLGVDTKDVKPSSLLKDRVREMEGNPDFSNKDINASQPPVVTEINTGNNQSVNQVEEVRTSYAAGLPNLSNQYASSIHHASSSLLDEDKVGVMIPERVASSPGLSQVASSPSPFSFSQLQPLINNYDAYIRVDQGLASMGLQFHGIIKAALDRAIREISPVIQCSVNVAIHTTTEIILKDFAMEPDDSNISRASRMMVGTLAGQLAHVTCKETLRAAFSNHLRTVLQANVGNELDQITQNIVPDILGIGCALIENVATAKAYELIEGKIAHAFASMRKHREATGFYDASSFGQGPFAFVPEALRPKPGLLTIAQQQVYKDFVRNAGQNLSSQNSSNMRAGLSGIAGGSVGSSMPRVFGSSSRQLRKGSIYSTSLAAPGFSTMGQTLDLLPDESDHPFVLLSVPSSQIGSSDGVIKPVDEANNVASFPANATYPDLQMLETSNVTKDLGTVVPPSPTPVSASERLGTILSESLLSTGEALDKYQVIAHKLETLISKEARDAEIQVLSGCSSGSKDDYNILELVAAEPGLHVQASSLFSKWCQICGLPEATRTHYISQLQQRGFLKGDDNTDRFFRILMELSVSHCLSTEQNINPGSGSLSLQSAQPHNITFTTIDAYAKLVVAVLKYGTMDHGSSKLVLLPKILSVTMKGIQKDAEEKKHLFNPRPYFRLFINLLLDLTCSDPILDGMNFQVLTSFANVFHALQPLKIPGWSFAWLELVSHRNFMPKLLTVNSPKGWPFFQRLLVDLFKFMEPYLRNAELEETLQFLYKGTLRVLLVLLHDFPEFLCEYHFSFCDVIPPTCIQMRNIILSAFPRNMKLPDPFTPNLKIDLLPEILASPRIHSDVDGALKAKQMKADIDEYLKTRQEGSPFLTELKQKLLLSPKESNLAGTRYNVPLINSLVLYVGMQAIQQLQSKSSPQQVPHSPPMDIFHFGASMDIFQNLIINLDTEGRYLFINAVANQLRYPNNHTHYFSFILLFLFSEAGQEIIQEQITRVLVERLMGSRPYPWGLQSTFMELSKNPRYNFWSCSFLHCTQEIEKLFETVPRSCGGQRTVDDGMVSGGGLTPLPDGSH